VDALHQADPIRAKLPASIEIFCVGGAVRDALLELPDSDRDYVVVGGTPEAMHNAGFTPVGQDFPVFLHPITHEEFALARTERKTASGYKGFSFQADPSVTLTQDLMRRDLTINAIALSREGNIIDPCGGLQDLEAHCLRHVGPAFSEDPVRLLRLARFAARWPHFSISESTLALCKEIVLRHEAQALVPERVWQEIAKGLMESQPSRMLDVLVTTGAWRVLAEKLPAPTASMQQQIDQAAKESVALECRFGLLMFNAGGDKLPLGLFKAPRACLELAELLQRQLSQPDHLDSLVSPKDINALAVLLEWLTRADVQRRPERFQQLLDCMRIMGVLSSQQINRLRAYAKHLCQETAHQQIAHAVRQAQQAGASIADAAHQARLDVLRSHPDLRFIP
jgi:tRNA nucleotidyltransferase (CCA-adding enzyme)